MEANFYFHTCLRLEITAILRIQSYKVFDRKVRYLDKFLSKRLFQGQSPYEL